MKKINKLGIFDSGLGGYSVFKELKTEFFDLDMVLFADQKNAPYGNYSSEKIIELSSNAMRWFLSQGIEDVLLACNTVTSVALDILKVRFPSMRIWGIVDLTVSQVGEGYKKVAMVGTSATVETHAYRDALGRDMIEVALPNLAKMVEDLESEAVIRDEIAKGLVSLDNLDCLVLGCTHYPLVKDVFSSLTDAVIVDSISPIIEFVRGNYNAGMGETRVVTTLDKNRMRHQIEVLYGVIEDVEDVL